MTPNDAVFDLVEFLDTGEEISKAPEPVQQLFNRLWNDLYHRYDVDPALVLENEDDIARVREAQAVIREFDELVRSIGIEY